MLSNLIISSQKFVLIIDNVGQERVASSTIKSFLREQGQDGDVARSLDPSDHSTESCYTKFINECTDSDKKVNVLLPVLSDIFLHHPRKSDLFQLIHLLKQNCNVKQIFLWASTKHIFETFTLACLEYMADIILNIENKETLSILTRKPGGLVSNKHYTYTKTKDSFTVELIKKTNKKSEKPVVKPDQLGTFKIELEEDELMARNALKMPYERTSETEDGGGGNIIYTPDKDDDFDEEDPDDDLYI